MQRGDAFDANCPVRHVLDRIGDKWSVLVVLSLRDGPRRFTELRQRIGGVTAKVLTQTLRTMEQDGLLGGDSRGRTRDADPISGRPRRPTGPG